MKRHLFCEVSLLISYLSISDCKQAIDTGHMQNFRQGLLIKHIQELAKTSHEFICFKHSMLLGGGWQRSINC